MQVRIQTYTLEVGAETKHARHKMGTRTVEGPSEELWSLASLVGRNTALTRVALFRAREVKVEILVVPGGSFSYWWGMLL